jgi:hypothetical protein
MEKDTAAKILRHVDAMLEQGNHVLHVVNNACSENERKRYHEILGTAVANIDMNLLEPIYKQFPDLRPKDMEEIKSK